MERPEYILTRTDFESSEEWARYCHEAGLLPDHDGRGRQRAIPGSGHYAQLRQAIFGSEPGPARPTRAGPTTTIGISRYGFERVMYANAFACWSGHFMSCHLAVTWTMMMVGNDAAIAALHTQFSDALRRWLLRHGLFEGYFWVLEKSNRRGLHSHFLVRVPPSSARALEAWVSEWLRRKTGKLPPKTTNSKAIYVRAEWVKSSIEQRMWIRYFLKGGDGSFSIPGLKMRAQGTITGKRYGIARCLDEQAQRLAGFPRGEVAPFLTGQAELDGRFDRGRFSLARTLQGSS